jgi:hypothetical protein
MKNLISLTVVLIVLVIWNSCEPADDSSADTQDIASAEVDMVKRGEYLVIAMGCDDCHSPKIYTDAGPEPDMTKRFMGHPADMVLPEISTDALPPGWVSTNEHFTAWVGPWGVSFSGNITSDESGIGNWTEENFFRAIREGKFKGLENGRPLLPPMPWPQYRYLNDEDIRAIFAYLRTTTPIRNVVPPPIPPG